MDGQQQQQNQQNQPQMTADRNKLTDKELNYVKDFMSWELLAMKKCKDNANRCVDKDIQTLINQIGQKHLQHFESLLTLVQ